MSDSEEEGPSPAPDGQEEPIAPVAPKVSPHDELGQAEVSSSPAFQYLDDLFNTGALTGTRMAQLKAIYSKLHETLKVMRDAESSLLEDAKKYTVEIEKQKIELERAENFPEGYNNDTAKLRVELLKHYNELDLSADRVYQLEFKIENQLEEKKMIDREYHRMPKQAEVDKQIKDLTKSCDDMRQEIAQRKLEVKNLKEEVDSRNRQLDMDRKEFETEVSTYEDLKNELVMVYSVPAQISKECDKLLRQKNEVDKKNNELHSEFDEQMSLLNELEEQQQKLEEDKIELDDDLDRQRTRLDAKQREFDTLMKDYDYAKERENVLLGDRATLDLSLKHLLTEKKNYHETHSRLVREKDRDVKNLKKAELQLRVAMDSLSHTQGIFEKTKSMLDSAPKDDGSLLEKRKELQREVDANKRALAQQNSQTGAEQNKVDRAIKEEEKLRLEQADNQIEVVELSRLAGIKADEREQKARDFMKADLRFKQAADDLAAKQLSIGDHRKKCKEMQQKLKDFAKLYDIIKNERNKCVNLIQTSTQRAAEMREKIKILQNEIEILRSTVNTKEKHFQKARLKHMNAIVVRDSLRNEMSKQRRIEAEMIENREQQRMDIAKLNMMINQAEEQMVQLRKRYETAVQHRNDRGVTLIERNEEVCIFYEKVNIQETMIRNGDVELQAKEEEIRFLNMQVTELKRQVHLLRRQVPEKRGLENELAVLQIQLSQCEDLMLELEKRLENPHDPSRVRYLEGDDGSPEQLNRKIEQLEVRLAEKEEQLLEKDLVFEQVTRLTDRVRKKAESGKEDTLAVAKKVNDLQAKIKDVTRKMMALVSELAMNQATAMRLQQQVKGNEADLEQAYIRMERGDPPNDETRVEWEKYLITDMRREDESEERKHREAEEEHYKLAGGTVTTAEPRPNAYIPDDDSDLPIPRPYGSNAPFKPQLAGSNMRHIRKPIVKPIEI